MAWYTEELKKYRRRSKSEKEKERLRDNNFWRQFLYYSPVNHQNRREEKNKD